MPTAKSSTSFSTSENSALVAWSGSARSCASVTPFVVEIIEPMSMQNSQPASAAALVAASALRSPGTRSAFSVAYSSAP